MKTRLIRSVLYAVLVPATPLLTFAGGQPARVYTPVRNEGHNRAGIVPAVQQGKGTGMSRNPAALRLHDSNLKTAKEKTELLSGNERTKPGEPAFSR
jgi:hypothetical protein